MIRETMKYITLQYDDKQDLWIGEFRVEADDINGVWEIYDIYINKENNETIYLAKEDLKEPHKSEITVKSGNTINPKETANISGIETIGNREKIGFKFFADKEILEALVNLSEGHILLANKDGETKKVEINESKRAVNTGEINFIIPLDTQEGTWEFKEIVLSKNEKTYRLDHFFLNHSNYGAEFYVPSIEADRWVRTHLASKLQKDDNTPFYGDYLHLVSNSYFDINSFIERYKKALPPYVKEVDYHDLLNYTYKGWESGMNHFYTNGGKKD